MDLFDTPLKTASQPRSPLADRIRPRSLADVVGQDQILGEGKLLRILVEKKEIPSLILWGPSGVGKTTIGWLIGREMNLPFVSLSAVTIGMKEVKEVFHKARLQRIILFVDEFHRFNKLQQDSFLPHVENGTITLIGATTENPSFEIISPLLSRMKVITLNPLSSGDMVKIVKRALSDDEVLKKRQFTMSEETMAELALLANGDARHALNLLEIASTVAAVDSEGKTTIDHTVLKEAFQRNIATYDKKGEYHYDFISAFHKSMRGSDPDASLYWLARMIENGEDPLYILRRMVRFASEDIGNADPAALGLTVAATEAFRFLGPPEGFLAIAQAAVYLALAEKSNAIYRAYGKVSSDVRHLPAYPVPLHLRNAPTQLMADLGYGKDYLYPHDFENGIVEQEYLPDEMKGTGYYRPTDRGYERRLRQFMDTVRQVTRQRS